MISIKKAQLKQIVAVSLFLLLFSIIVIAINTTTQKVSTNTTNTTNQTEPTLATIVNGKNIFDDPYIHTYFSRYNNLSDVDFKTLAERGSSAILKIGNVKNNIEGFILGNKKYAIHLVGCKIREKTCNLRINGAVFKDLSPDGTNTVDLDEDYSMRVKTVKIDYCDNRPVCDYLFQSYDLVEVEVVKK